MGTTRVTQSILVERVLLNLQNQSRRILQLQDQLATGRRINAPSDDPTAARRAISTQNTISRNEQYIDNITAVRPQLSETTLTAQTVVDALRRARELALQGANGTNSQEQRDLVALEINQIIESVLQSSNHVTNGRYLFAGTRSLNPAFSATRSGAGEITSVAYDGNAEQILAKIGDGVTVPVNLTGDVVFQNNVDVFQTLIDLRDNLRANDLDAIQTRLDEMNTAQTDMLTSLARIGSFENRLDRVSSDTDSFNFQLEEVLSETVDADFAEVTLNLNAQSNAFQAALSAGARVIQPSLLDFIQ